MGSDAGMALRTIGRRLTLDRARLGGLLAAGGEASRSLGAARGRLSEAGARTVLARRALFAMAPPSTPAASARLETGIDSLRRKISSNEAGVRSIMLEVAGHEARTRAIDASRDQVRRRIDRLEGLSRGMEAAVRSETWGRELGELTDLAAVSRLSDPAQRYGSDERGPHHPLPPAPATRAPDPADAAGPGSGAISSGTGSPGEGRREGGGRSAIDKLRVWRHCRTASIELAYSPASGMPLTVRISRASDGLVSARLVAPDDSSRALLARERGAIMRSLSASGVRLRDLVVTKD